ncbi:MAG: PH domain-containing protein [Chloroflexi bacterium]|nr:PH domain-containing protein [Chloroflexota bacterium]
MNTANYPPPRQPGIAIHASLILTLAVISTLGTWRAFESEVGLKLTLFILLAVAAFIPLPILAYRLSALARANYSLDRDTLALKWGLRVERIPVSDVEWVRPIADLTSPLPLPWLRLPGSVLGVRHHPDFGPVEFLASNKKKILLVATARRVFAISPNNPAAFVQDFQRAIEMGSLEAAPAQSLYPTFVIARAWESTLARYFWLAGLFLNIGLSIWVSLLIPALPRVSLGFQPSGAPLEPVAGVRLILLPILSLFFFIISWLSGLYFYRSEDQRTLAFILWAASALTALLFLLAVLFIVTTPI